MKSPNTTCCAIILAAGDSRRMGQEKPSLPWLNGLTLLEWTVKTLSCQGWQPFVVLGPHNYPNWSQKLKDTQTVLNDDSLRRKTTSIAAGAGALPESAQHVLLTSADQPRPPELYRRLRICAEERKETVIAPDHNGHCGHPVILKASLRSHLLSLSEESFGLRSLLEANKDSTFLMPADPEWLQWNLNTPERYKESFEWFISNNINN